MKISDGGWWFGGLSASISRSCTLIDLLYFGKALRCGSLIRRDGSRDSPFIAFF